MNKKILVIICALVFLVSCTKPSSTKYSISDYIEIEEILIEGERSRGEFEDITFKKIPSSITDPFMKCHSNFIEHYARSMPNPPGEGEGLVWTQKFKIEITGSILSILETSEIEDAMTGVKYSPILQSLNVDLNEMRLINNDEFLENIQKSTEEVYISVLTDALAYIHVDSLLINPDGIVKDSRITLEHFEKTIPDMATNLVEDYGSEIRISTSECSRDVVVFYYSDGDPMASYNLDDLLKTNGLSDHMGYGIEGNAHAVNL